ncbi:MAG: hypothetical protein U0354_01760 [Candidatus Sericytochromatia bacterium]
MLGNNREPDKKGNEAGKKFPSSPFSKPTNAPQNNNPLKAGAKPGEKKMDNFQRTNKAERGTGPLNANSNMNLTKEPPPNRNFTETILDDGVKITKYDVPQKIENLIKDAKSQVGGENPKFISKGWVIGKEIAKISPDGLSITYYPSEVADLVQEISGYQNIDENK